MLPNYEEPDMARAWPSILPIKCRVTKYYDKLLRFTVFIVDISYPIRAFFFHKECTGGAVCGMSYPRIVTWSPTTLKKVTYWALNTIVEAQVEKASFS